MRNIFVSVLLMMIITVQVIAQGVSFEAKVSKRSLGLNERLRVDFVMNENGDDLLLRASVASELFMDPISPSAIHGSMEKVSLRLTHIFDSHAKRGLSINQATIDIDGEIYKTTPVKITVMKRLMFLETLIAQNT